MRILNLTESFKLGSDFEWSLIPKRFVSKSGSTKRVDKNLLMKLWIGRTVAKERWIWEKIYCAFGASIESAMRNGRIRDRGDDVEAEFANSVRFARGRENSSKAKDNPF